MMHEMISTLGPAEVLARATTFFSECVPHLGAFPEKQGPGFATFRGQGGEELTIAVFEGPGGTRIRASSPLFDQAIGRFFSTLPAAEGAA